MASLRSLSLLAFLCCSLLTAGVSAQAPAPRAEPRLMAPSTQLKLGSAAFGGALAGAALSAGAGFAIYAALDCGACDGEEDVIDRETRTLIFTSLAAAALIPGTSVAMTRLAGVRSGVPGRLRWLFGGAYIGLGIAVVGTVALTEAIRPDRGLPIYATAVGLAVVTVGGMTTIFHRVSVRRELRLVPTVAPTAHGATLGLAGRF